MQSQELSYLSISSKNIFFTIYSKITGMVVNWLYQGCSTFHIVFQNLHSFKLMLESSSHPEVFCKKVVLENFVNSLENICAGVSLGKLQDVCKFFEIFRGNLFRVFFRKGNIILTATTLNQQQGRVPPSTEVLFKK